MESSHSVFCLLLSPAMQSGASVSLPRGEVKYLLTKKRERSRWLVGCCGRVLVTLGQDDGPANRGGCNNPLLDSCTTPKIKRHRTRHTGQNSANNLMGPGVKHIERNQTIFPSFFFFSCPADSCRNVKSGQQKKKKRESY